MTEWVRLLMGHMAELLIIDELLLNLHFRRSLWC